jgi:hypothetical protein
LNHALCGLPEALLAATYQQAGGGVKPGNFWLENKIIRRRTGMFFETGGKVSANITVKYQGTRCESGTVAPL